MQLVGYLPLPDFFLSEEWNEFFGYDQQPALNLEDLEASSMDPHHLVFGYYCWNYRLHCQPDWDPCMSESDFVKMPLGVSGTDHEDATVRSVMGVTPEEFAMIYDHFLTAFGIFAHYAEACRLHILTTSLVVDGKAEAWCDGAVMVPSPADEADTWCAEAVKIDAPVQTVGEDKYLRKLERGLTRNSTGAQAHYCDLIIQGERATLASLRRLLRDHGIFRHARDVLDRGMGKTVVADGGESPQWAAYCKRRGLGRNSQAALQELFQNRPLIRVVSRLAALGIDARQRERLAAELNHPAYWKTASDRR